MTALRVAAFAFALTAVSASAWAADVSRPPERRQLLQDAGQALARGDAIAALRDYEAAAAQEHAVDIEVGIVHGLMGTGQYRRALAFAAHSAGAHGGDIRGPSLYARLLDLGGQPLAARRVSEAAAARRPQDGATQEFEPGAEEGYAPLAAGEEVAGAALLVDGGRRAVVASRVMGSAARLALRDGLGRRSVARLVDRDEQLGLSLVELEPPMEGAPLLSLPAREPFAGSAAYSVAPSCVGKGRPCAPWPRMQLRFLGAAGDLGLETASGSFGGPVFDGTGLWLGLAVPDTSGLRLIPSALIVRRFRLAVAPAAALPGGPAPRLLPLDALYEVALRVSLQALSVDRQVGRSER